MATPPLPLWRRVYSGLNSRLRFFAGGRLARLCRPVSIAFVFTERCNARCVHCDIWKNKGREDSPTLDEWKKVLRELRAWLGPVHIVFTGGEVLLYPHALDLIEFAVSLGFSLEVLTNGYWSGQTIIERLALTNPWRITVSLDGIGETHSKIRGRQDFFERTRNTLETLTRVRSSHGLTFRILLKTVIMEHNLDELSEVARYAASHGIEVLYQPIEQNYGAPYDPLWFESSPNWPRNRAKAAEKVRELAALKDAGLPIGNSEAHFTAMVRYFQDPIALGLMTRAHVAQERRPTCCAMTSLELRAGGDVVVCANRPPIGNIRTTPIRLLWQQRARVWKNGCCLEEHAAEIAARNAGRRETAPGRA